MLLAHRLPMELLLHIFSYLSDFPHSSSRSRHFERNRDLKSCSLVCSTWRRLAQELLPLEIWFKPKRNVRSTEQFQLEELVSELDQIPFKNFKTGTLIVERTNLMLLPWNLSRLGQMNFKRFNDIRQLRILHADLEFGTISQLHNLNTLHLSNHYVFSRSNVEPFPYLHKLVLDRVTIGGNLESLEAWQKVFSPAVMPRVQKLALDARSEPSNLADIFVNLLPQLKSLSLNRNLSQHQLTGFFQAFPKNGSLKHLSFSNVDSSIKAKFFDKGTISQLESLHVDFSPPLTLILPRTSESRLATYIQAFKERVTELKRGKEKVGAKKLIVYGVRREYTSRVKGEYGKDVVWKKGERAPFLDFDGSY